MKLTALVANRIHPKLNGTPTHPSPTGPTPGKFSVSTQSPLPTASTAAPIWAPSLMVNGHSRTSSSHATPAIATDATISPRKYGSANRAKPAVAYSKAMPTRKATTTPTPPPFGTGCACAFRASGRSIGPHAIIDRTTTADSPAIAIKNPR